MAYKARYSGPNRSGICRCGHSWEEHHIGMVMKEQYIRDTGEIYIAQECEYFGCNEYGGLDQDGEPHCNRYVDNLNKDDEK